MKFLIATKESPTDLDKAPRQTLYKICYVHIYLRSHNVSRTDNKSLINNLISMQVEANGFARRVEKYDGHHTPLRISPMNGNKYFYAQKKNT